jgi:Tfp pilus assembly protein PilV
MVRQPVRRDLRTQRGMTMIEAVIAFFILLVVMLAVLEMFSLSIAVNRGSLARTDLAYRCEQVIETLRLEPSLKPASRNACAPLTGTFPVTLPQTGCEAYWGPSRANVTMADAPFTISYSIDSNLVLTVEGRANLSGTQYLGSANITKVVRYVAHL